MARGKWPKSKPRRSRNARLYAIAEREGEIRERLERLCHQGRNIQQFGREYSNLIAITKTMLETCLDTHEPVCAKHPFNGSRFQPTRSIDLKDVERPKLVISSAIKSQDRRYICLSHQWEDLMSKSD
jgi:hypothetical protein